MDIINANNTTTLQEIRPEYYTRFLQFVDASEKTIITYTRNLKQFALWLKNNGIKAPVREDIIQYKEELKARLKASTVNGYIIAVRLFFRWLDQEGLYPNIADHIKGVNVSKEHKKDYLTSNQVKTVLDGIDRNTLQGKRDYAIMCLMVTGGLRDIEVYRANIEDLSTIGDTSVLYLQGKGRNDKADYVKLPNETERAIREYLSYREYSNATEPLFTSMSNNSTGLRMSTRSISGVAKKYFKKAGYNSDRLTAHSLRHTAITLSLLGGNTLQEAQQFARHTNIATTQIYAHNLDKLANTCSNTVANAIF